MYVALIQHATQPKRAICPHSIYTLNLYYKVADYEYVTRKEPLDEETVNIKKLIGKHVLSKGGEVIGRISELRFHPDNFELEGVVVGRGFDKPIYIGVSYFDHISESSVILNTELSILMSGKRVVTIDGKVIGRVRKINRKGTTNELESIEISRLWKKYLIPQSEIKQVADSVILKLKYDATKDYLWKRPE